MEEKPNYSNEEKEDESIPKEEYEKLKKWYGEELKRRDVILEELKKENIILVKTSITASKKLTEIQGVRKEDSVALKVRDKVRIEEHKNDA